MLYCTHLDIVRFMQVFEQFIKFYYLSFDRNTRHERIVMMVKYCSSVAIGFIIETPQTYNHQKRHKKSIYMYKF